MKGSEKMRLIKFVLTLVIAVAFAGNALAVSSGKTIEYPGGSVGKVIFDGKTHAEKNLKCSECHPKIFPMKKGATITMAEMNAGKNCGACHNGEKAFKPGDAANCGKCHKR
jgi:c(7)-type cytochrome triheme protein